MSTNEPTNEPMNDPMNEADNNAENERGHAGAPQSGRDRDLLISRVIDGDASPEDWSTFRSLASRDPSIWSELGEAQHDHEALRESVRGAAALSDRVELPFSAPHPGSHLGSHRGQHEAHHQRRLDNAARWSGWGIAAMLAIVWLTQPRVTTSTPSETSSASMIPSGLTALKDASPDEALGRYIEAGQADGRVLGEMPEQLVVETRPTGRGTVEVIYLRQIIERRVLDRAYREVTDEFGNTDLVPVDLDTIEVDRAF